jgi:hypothetical protein
MDHPSTASSLASLGVNSDCCWKRRAIRIPPFVASGSNPLMLCRKGFADSFFAFQEDCLSEFAVVYCDWLVLVLLPSCWWGETSQL